MFGIVKRARRATIYAVGGAVAAYLMDPDRGAERRRQLSNQVGSMRNKAQKQSTQLSDQVHKVSDQVTAVSKDVQATAASSAAAAKQTVSQAQDKASEMKDKASEMKGGNSPAAASPTANPSPTTNADPDAAVDMSITGSTGNAAGSKETGGTISQMRQADGQSKP